MFKNLKKNIFLQKVLNSVCFGFSISLLPVNISKIYNLFILRVFRVIGGCCVVLYITNYYLCFYSLLSCLIFYFFVIQSVHIIVLFIIKIGYFIVLYRSIKISKNQFYGVVYFAISLKVIFIIFMEGIGLLSFDIIQYIEIINHLYDIKKCFIRKINKFI